ncbi:scd2/ral3 [Emericellopsis atlantica]|uniref:Scd2/ral3 n=1 Tax=Emericellopsis atlantica TaxID=2614577 RepID=A0A9P8CUI4_9HYPO|nr:scd2/ral3 [Emericellopsis atlantica]KAG9259050.1 scd2/ral3 [Emericellopsis atlantica]
MLASDEKLTTMRFVQALRRSIKGEKEKTNSHVAPKHAVAIVPPKKVIKALYDYEARSDQELGFSRGDFFHVIGREDDTDWYEACNPALPDARGLVPVAFFQSLGKTEGDDGSSGRVPSAGKMPNHDSGYSDSHGGGGGVVQGKGISGPISGPMPAAQRKSQPGKNGPMVYGVVMFDFAAERADELDAKQGEAIIVIAQSNPEWFVAKPIGRLGGPGLIPVSFIELRDMASDKPLPNPEEALRKAGVPKVEEWKKMAAEYKNSSITLGKFEVGSGGGGQPMEQSMERLSIQQNGRQSSQTSLQQQQNARTSQRSAGHQSQQLQQNQYASKSTSQLYAPIQARIPRYCFAEEKYWFVIEAMLEDGRQWVLSRYYEDFYDFQIALLTEFPAEAGNTGTQKRTLPYMPGPVNYVTNAITEGRLHNLDAYVKNLLNQPPYISRCLLVKQFFAPREGDYELELNEGAGDYRLSQGSQMSSNESPADGSRQSSRNNLNGGGYGGLSATPRQMGHQASHSHSQSQSQPQGSAMKVKMYYNGDLIAIRVPSDIAYQQLFDKIRDRLKVPDGDQIQLFYKDEATGDKPNLMSDNDLDYALQHNEKLLLYVEVV